MLGTVAHIGFRIPRVSGVVIASTAMFLIVGMAWSRVLACQFPAVSGFHDGR